MGDAPFNGSNSSYNNSYIVFGRPGVFSVDMHNLSPASGIVMPRNQADGANGSGRMDVNGDGLPDIYVGSYTSNAK